VAAVRLLIFTGARMTEILTLRWSWIDHVNGVIRLLDSKTGAKTIHLSARARAVLDGLPRVSGLTSLSAVRRGRIWSTSKSCGGASVRRLDSMTFACKTCGTRSPASGPGLEWDCR
jgi:integrase